MWLVAFKDAGLLFRTTRISIKPRKVNCIDHALVTSVSSGVLTNHDSLLEKLPDSRAGVCPTSG